ncbi:MAG TPA: hypothetical protein VH418_11910 [Solirubrobacteraceae bacterium]|jgi:hypothetical protein
MAVEHSSPVQEPDGDAAAADVKDASARGPVSSVLALQRRAGNRAAMAALGLGRRALQRLGYPLGKPLPKGAEKPKHGETPGKQRRYSKAQFEKMWEAEQGHPLTGSQKSTIDRGCIGITANNLGVVDPPLDEVYDSFAKAHAAMDNYNNFLTWYPGKLPYVMFGMLFWSNQDPDEDKRVDSNPTAFRADPNTGKVDMTGYDYLERPGFVNFDYGFWDEAVQCFWHANHMEYDPPRPKDPMKVFQSTADKFAHKFSENGEPRFGYRDFDRVVYGVAPAANYDPSKSKANP